MNPGKRGRVPIDLRIELRADARDSVMGLVIQHVGGDVDYGRNLSFRREEVTFRNGDVVLSGTLILPDGPGPPGYLDAELDWLRTTLRLPAR